MKASIVAAGIAAGLGVLPALTFAQVPKLDGTYSRDPLTCSDAMDRKTAVLAGNDLWIFGKVCKLKRPVDVIDMDARLYSLTCKDEPKDWTVRIMLLQDKTTKGMIVVGSGYAVSYAVCTDAPPQEAAAPETATQKTDSPDPAPTGTAPATTEG